jgi:pimeloyl-ACP methyl ester carboxylesterase
MMIKRCAMLMVILGSCLSAIAQLKPSVVLVHGAFADGSSWNEVASRLRKDGYTVLVSANPLRGIPQDRDSLAALLKTVSGPIVLVGQSYGGAVISNTVAASGDVKALVFVAGLAPDEGESVADLANKFEGSRLVKAISPAPLADGSADLYVQRDQFRAVLAADVSSERAEQMAFSQRPAAQATLMGKSGTPLWRSVPSWFIYGDADLSLPPALHAFLAQRANSQKTIVIRGGSHDLNVSHPSDVVKIIEVAASSKFVSSPSAMTAQRR